MLSEPVLVLVNIARIFNSLDIRYLVGGSFASSIYGIPRATQDVDLVADISIEHVSAFMKEMTDEFYVEENMIRDAIFRSGSFNILHLKTMFKADIFILQRDAWSRLEMERARTEELVSGELKACVRFASAEDVLLHKLIWFRIGDQISDRQWNDIIGIIKVQGTQLDHKYLDQWAPLLDVDDLLARAITDCE